MENGTTPLRLAGFALAAAATLALAACSGAPATADGDEPADGELTQIQVGIIPSPDSAVLYLGQDQGFFEDHGFELTFNAAQGLAAIVPPVVSGQWQLGFSNVVSIMQAVENGQPLVMLNPSGTTWGEEGKGINKLYAMGDSGIDSAKDLEGKTVVVNTLDNLLQTEAEVSIAADGGDVTKVKFTEMPPPNGVAALVEGTADAMMCNEPFCMQIEDKGGVLLDDSSYTIAPGVPTATAAWFTTQSQIDADPEMYAELQAALAESHEYAMDHPDEARAKMTEVVDTFSPEEAESMLLNNWPPTFEGAALEPLAKAAVEFGHLKAEPDYDTLVWTAP